MRLRSTPGGVLGSICLIALCAACASNGSIPDGYYDELDASYPVAHPKSHKDAGTAASGSSKGSKDGGGEGGLDAGATGENEGPATSGGRGGSGATSGGKAGAGSDPTTTPADPQTPPADMMDMTSNPVTVDDADITFEIRTADEHRGISKLIYGTNGSPEIDTTHQTVLRSGGNRLTAYNWENNASNAGKDYQYQNDDLLSASNTAGQAALDAVQAASAAGATSIITVPIVDYVAADKNKGGDVRNSGADYLMTRFKQNRPTKGSAFAYPPDTSDAFVYQDEFVSWLKGKAGSTKVIFSLDNEPELWFDTHPEVHPDHVTYDELWTRNRDYARAIKGVWPQAEVLGFVSYGFNGYVNLQSASDANGRDFIEWYLDQAKAEQDSTGTRIIDYLDLHWYPEAYGTDKRVIVGDSTPDLIEAREQAPRSLWDDTYKENSWIVGYLNAPIDLLHRLQTKVTGHYPGTRLAFTEWNYGGGEHISGAIAVADVLGIFGQRGVGLATYWGLNGDERFAYAAMRIYRNYDGSGAHFGDTSVAATSSDVAGATVYASIDSGDPNHCVIVVISKANAPMKAAIKITHPTAFTTAKVWTLSGTDTAIKPGTDLTSAGDNTFVYEMPEQSISVIVPE